MRCIKIILVFLSVTNSIQTFSQKTNNSIEYISYKYYNTLRIPYSEVTIEIYKNKNYAFVKVSSKAADDNKKWDYSRFKREFKIDLRTFEELSNRLIALQTVDLNTEVGLDGTSSIIKFGNSRQNYEFTVWTPEDDTQQSGLQYFLDCCKELISLGKLDPKEILRE